MFVKDQAGVSERVRGGLQPGPDRGEEMQLSEIPSVLNSVGRHRALRVVGLMFEVGDAIERGEKILGFVRSGNATDLLAIAEGLDPFLRVLDKQISQVPQQGHRLAFERVQIEKEDRVFQSVRGVVRCFQQGSENCVVGTAQTAARVSETN